MGIFTAPTIEQTTDEVARHFPDGSAWAAKYIPDSIFYKILKSNSKVFNIIQNQIESLVNDYNIYNSIDLLPDWEESVGIPDGCTGISDNIEQRRNDVIQRYSKIPIVNIEEIKEYAEKILGLPVIVQTGYDGETIPLTLPFPISGTNSLFKIYITIQESLDTIPLTLPFTLGSANQELLQCSIRKILPANVVLIIRSM